MFLRLAWLLCLTPFFFHQTANGDSVCVTAIINITYVDQISGRKVSEVSPEAGIYGDGPVRSEKGTAISIKTNKGCQGSFEENIPEKEKWIAVIERGECYFSTKIENAAKHNSTAVVIYDDEPDLPLVRMHNTETDFTENIVGVFVDNYYGRKIVNLLDNRTDVYMEISPGQNCPEPPPAINSLSVLFVSVSFITLMVVSLAWLVFYYIQRFRFSHIRSKAQKRLGQATKKAIHKISQRTIKSGDKELDEDFDNCAICIESYTVGDCIRILPCKHVYHKSCVDEWLLLHQTCPICKLNIIKALGGKVTEGENDDVNNSNVVETTNTWDVEAPVAAPIGPLPASEGEAPSPPTTHQTAEVVVHPEGHPTHPVSFDGGFENRLNPSDEGSTVPSQQPELNNENLCEINIEENGRDHNKKHKEDKLEIQNLNSNNDNSVV